MQDDRVSADRASVPYPQNAALAKYLRAGADIHPVANDDMNGRSIRSIIAASDLNLVIDIAVATDFYIRVDSGATAMVVQACSGTNDAFGRQTTVEYYVSYSLNQPWYHRDVVKVTPVSDGMKF